MSDARVAQFNDCPNGKPHLAEWYPLKKASDARWYVRCRDCNVEGYVVPTWLVSPSAAADPDPYEPLCSLCGKHHYGGGCG